MYPPSIKAEALKLIRAGATYRTVAQKLKVSASTLSKWAKDAPKADAKTATNGSVSAIALAIVESNLSQANKVLLLRLL